MKKSIMAILGTSVILLSLLAPLMIRTGVAADPTGWYKTVNGVLDTDTYSLYPYDTSESLTIGFSQFGEFINTLDNTGLQFDEVDPFAPPGGTAVGAIVKSAWLNGWYINISYFHTIRNEMRTVWASAQHGDPIGVTYGNGWIRVDFANDKDATYGLEDARDPGFLIGNYAAGSNQWGGRKTNGTAVTSPMVVLYDGPRLFVARLKTTISDHFVYLSDDTTEDGPLLEVWFTITFNKVKKEVVVFKELKTLFSDKYADYLKVQFSNRGEVDLGVDNTGYASYFHFYTEGESRGLNWMDTGKNYESNDTIAEGLDTVYDSSWVMNITEDPVTSPFYNYSAAGPYPQSYGATYDVAVAVNPVEGYTFWAAFWPSLNDWNIDGWPMWWRSMEATDPHDIDSRTWELSPRYEPTIPFYIGEWDVVLKPAGKKTPSGNPDMQQYRFVTIYGVTYQNDAEDMDQGQGYYNVIDRETLYQLNEYFNPWDLYSAVEKKNTRWVEYSDDPIGYTSWITEHKPVMDVSWYDWDQYCTFAERVEDLTTGELLYRRNGDYDFWVDDDGYGHFSGLDEDHWYKFLYSTDTEYADWGPFELYDSWIGTTSIDYFNAYDYAEFEDWLGAYHEMEVWAYFEITPLTELAIGDSFTLTGNTEYEAYDFKVFKEGNFETDCESDFYWHHEDSNNYFSIDLTYLDIDWMIWPPSGLDLHMDILNFDLQYEIFVVYNGTEGEADTWNVTATFTVVPDDENEGAPIYGEHIPGRYEWGIVGRDAYSVDSAGLANVAAAFKNKQVEFGLGGADMYDPEIAAQMPWIMAQIGEGDMWADYYYGSSDWRTAFKDDWCTTWPISTSNIIAVGGPLANMPAFYGNDFTEALFGLSAFTSYSAWQNQIVPRTCWNLQDTANTYASSNTVGYAVIATYKDINGTVLFLIWGHWGRDTYYVTKWFHEEGIFQLQEAPAGVTSIIVEIDYKSYPEGYKPTGYSIVEVLGTISETRWMHGSELKGGIHDP